MIHRTGPQFPATELETEAYFCSKWNLSHNRFVLKVYYTPRGATPHSTAFRRLENGPKPVERSAEARQDNFST